MEASKHKVYIIEITEVCEGESRTFTYYKYFSTKERAKEEIESLGTFLSKHFSRDYLIRDLIYGD